MKFHEEIVGAVVDAVRFTTDLHAIGDSLASGRAVEYVSRERATSMARRRGDVWELLAKSPTLFLREQRAPRLHASA